MNKKISVFHSTINTPPLAIVTMQKIMPEIQVVNVVDDSIVPELQANGNRYTPGILRRLHSFGVNAQMQGAKAALCFCTTINPAVRQVAPALDIPFLAVDGPMLTEAAKCGNRIALLVTAETTIISSTEAAHYAAQQAGNKDAVIDTILVEGAFEALNYEKNREKHDRLIAEYADKALLDHDVVALGQVSMTGAIPLIKESKKPVLTSLETGMAQLLEYL